MPTSGRDRALDHGPAHDRLDVLEAVADQGDHDAREHRRRHQQEQDVPRQDRSAAHPVGQVAEQQPYGDARDEGEQREAGRQPDLPGRGRG